MQLKPSPYNRSAYDCFLYQHVGLLLSCLDASLWGLIGTPALLTNDHDAPARAIAVSCMRRRRLLCCEHSSGT